MVLTNPPFGKSQSLLFVNEEGDTEKEDQVIVREDFWTSTSNKQLNFVQHIKTLHGIKRFSEFLKANPKIDVMWHTELDEVLGTDDPLGVNGARLKSTLTGETISLPIDGIFIAIGHAPGQVQHAP